MSLADTRSGYGWISIINHWVVAVLILVLIAVGLIIADMPPGPDKGLWIGLHKTTGVLALALALLRLGWQAVQRGPGPIEGQPPLANTLRLLMHRSLLALTVLVPLSGILMSLYNDHPVSLLGLATLPAQGEVPWIGAPAHVVHEWGSYLILLLVAAHALVSLKHHFVDGDVTLRRMLRSDPR